LTIANKFKFTPFNSLLKLLHHLKHALRVDLMHPPICKWKHGSEWQVHTHNTPYGIEAVAAQGCMPHACDGERSYYSQTHGAGQTKPRAGDNCSETCVHHNRRQAACARACPLSLSNRRRRLYLQVVLLGAQVNKATAARPPRPTLAIRSALCSRCTARRRRRCLQWLIN
jgi:hypothetical protein